MPKRKPSYPEKPWTPNPDRWRKLIDSKKSHSSKLRSENPQPKGGWQLWDWKTLEDKPQ